MCCHRGSLSPLPPHLHFVPLWEEVTYASPCFLGPSRALFLSSFLQPCTGALSLPLLLHHRRLYMSLLSPLTPLHLIIFYYLTLSLALSIAFKFSRERSNNYPLRSVQQATQYTPSPHLTSHTHLAARLAYSNNKRPASPLIPRYPRTGSSSWPDQYVIRLNMQTCKNEW